MAESSEGLGSWLAKLLGRQERLNLEGKKAIDAAKGSGIRAEEARQQSAGILQMGVQELITKYERGEIPPELLPEVEKKIRQYRKIARKEK
jgi:hypothetical protein